MSNFFYSLISLLTAIFFILLGIASVMLPWSPFVRTELVQFILGDSITIFLFGFAFIIIGLAIAINIILSSRRKYFHLHSGPKSIWIDETIIQDYLITYWKQLFPQSEVPSKLTLKKNKIHLIADLPYIPLDQQKDVLERIKNDLSELFGTFFGYQEPFYLSASFQPKQIEKPAK